MMADYVQEAKCLVYVEESTYGKYYDLKEQV